MKVSCCDELRRAGCVCVSGADTLENTEWFRKVRTGQNILFHFVSELADIPKARRDLFCLRPKTKALKQLCVDHVMN